jgi:hypothetical protein
MNDIVLEHYTKKIMLSLNNAAIMQKLKSKFGNCFLSIPRFLIDTNSNIARIVRIELYISSSLSSSLSGGMNEHKYDVSFQTINEKKTNNIEELRYYLPLLQKLISTTSATTTLSLFNLFPLHLNIQPSPNLRARIFITYQPESDFEIREELNPHLLHIL